VVHEQDTDVHDNDYHGVNLPASPKWTKFQIAFKDLTQRGFGAPEPFDGHVLNISFLVPPNVQPPNARSTAFGLEVDAIAFSGGPTTSSTSGVTQAIKFGTFTNKTLGTGPFALTATATSGLPVEFTSTTLAVCTISQNYVTLVAAGTCSITASQPGSSIYEAATPVIQTFTVSGQISQKITFTPLSNQTLGRPAIALTAVASSSLPVTFVSNTVAVCKVAGVNVTLVATGTCSITATQTGNATYASAPVVTQTFTVSAPTLTAIAVAPTNPSVAKGATLQLAVTGTYSDNSTRDLTASVAWTSATASVTTVAAGGLAAGAGTGTSKINAALGPVNGSTLLTVTAPVVKNPAIHAVVQGGQVSGTVSGVTPPQSFRAIVFAQTNEFYIQPCATTPLTAITPNGTWGPINSHNGTIFALLVSASYSPPSATPSLPAVDGVNVFAVTGPSGTISGSNVVACPSQ
jgi:hypothetical protein